MYEIMVVVGSGMATGFRLTGVKVREAAGPEDVQKALEFALDAENKVGLVVVDEDLLAGTSERTRQRCDRSAIPLVLPLPLAGTQDPEGQAKAVEEMVRSAIGFTIKLD